MKQEITKEIENKFVAAIEQHQLVDKNERILLGVSGGSDSMALLHLFAANFGKTELVAVYIDHGLRKEEIKKECCAVKEMCRQLTIPFWSKKVKVDTLAAQGFSIEEAARILRYKAFREIARQNDCKKIAVAHTADDQVENFFLRLIRGAGVSGVKGMRYKNGDIIRPLLDFRKKELQEYLLQKKICWFDDSSNSDPAFLRNRVRLQLLPLLKKDFSPTIEKQVLQFMQIVGEEDVFLMQEVENIWQDLIEEKKKNHPLSIELKAKKFSAIHKALQRRIIEKCIVQMQGAPSFLHIEQIIHLAEKALERNYQKNQPEIHLAGGLRVEKRGGKIIFHRPLPPDKKRGSATNNPPCPCFHIEVNAPGSYQLPENSGRVEICLYPKKKGEMLSLQNTSRKTTLYLDAAKAPFPMLLRPTIKESGERFCPYKRAGSKKISRYFSDKKIPLDKRGSWPLLCHNNQVAAIVGLEIDDSFKITKETKEILVVSLFP